MGREARIEDLSSRQLLRLIAREYPRLMRRFRYPRLYLCWLWIGAPFSSRTREARETFILAWSAAESAICYHCADRFVNHAPGRPAADCQFQ